MSNEIRDAAALQHIQDGGEDTFNAGWAAAISHATQVQTEWSKKQMSKVIDVFEEADEDTLADDIMQDVFTALNLVEVYTR